ncbi:Indole-3-glycerol phosphate synthase (EC [Olavius sp. associated proteobacterium Delta 1]|nr:Indole-3-glycerol phosphate synthase (EC [Olavius sp. associated proteobacterium Delta 1]
MHQRLAEIIAEKKNEVAGLKKAMPVYSGSQLPSIRDFRAAVSAPNRINLIAEIKFASPSAGRIRSKTDPILIGRIYEDSGAAAISLLTDKRFFQGDLNQLPRLKKAISLPILRKDFIIDEVQVRQSFVYGADAILLIARILSQAQLAELISACRALGMDPLTEVHDRDDLEKAIDAGAEIIGINNRDLDSFTIDINTTFELAPLVPADRVVISESGLAEKADIRSLKDVRVQAVLVGSALMKSDDLAGKTTELVDAGII